MTTIYRDIILDFHADQAWAMLRDFGNAGQVFAGALTDARVEGDVRTVTFRSGLVVRERLIAVDDERRRMAYSVLGEPFTHHSASMQIVPTSSDQCRFIWISDFLPNGVAEAVSQLVDEGCEAIKRNLKR